MKIGNVNIENKVFLAPMAGVTDLPFRLLCREMGCGLLYTEMVSAKAILYNNKNTDALLRVTEKVWQYVCVIPDKILCHYSMNY